MTAGPRRFPVAPLAACVLGLVVCPFAYFAVGALSDLRAPYRYVMVPAFLLASGALLVRYLAKPTEQPGRRLRLLVIEVASWIAIAIFLFIVSGLRLMTGVERVGAACAAFMLASALCLPVVLIRRTALEQRLARLPTAALVTALLAILATSSAAVIAYLTTPPRFI